MATVRINEQQYRQIVAGPRQRQPGMNKLEQAWAAELENRKRLADVLAYKFESVKLRLAPDTFYTPDFLVVRASVTFPGVTEFHTEFHEVKGFWRDDARVKIKVAAEMFPWFEFIAVRRVHGQWQEERF